MDYIGNHCGNLDYAFKGDDDIIVLPPNLALLLKRMEDEHSVAVGCLKDGEHVNRDIKSKYFMPDDLVPIAKYPKYFSGAGYILDSTLILTMNHHKNEIPLFKVA